MNTSSPTAPGSAAPPTPLVFYDGGCPLCAREIAHYRRLDTAGRLQWIDAADTTVSLADYGLTHEQAMAELHVMDTAGHWQRGIDAFVLIWSCLPAYRWLARLVIATRLRRPLAFAYRHFARWRYRRRCNADGCLAADTARDR